MATRQTARKGAAGETGPTRTTAAPALTDEVDNLTRLQDMEVEVSIEIGRRKLTLDQALVLGEQSVLELDKGVAEPVLVRLNGKPFARGEVVTVAENFGVRLTEILHGEGEV
ncbi:MAG: FliM/FliN family flagellar motor switch protein [Candidatus Latescibacterota bacterium]|jgi:flagellar motor switch protein FliN/FliY